MKIEDVENPKTKIVTRAISDSYARQLKENDNFQFERRGYFKVDKLLQENGKLVLDVIFTPDGRLKNMTANLETQVDAAKLSRGTVDVKPASDKPTEEPKLSKKQQKKLEKKEEKPQEEVKAETQAAQLEVKAET